MQTEKILGLVARTHLQGIPQISHDFFTINTCSCVLTNNVREFLGNAMPLFSQSA
jgi:hypothetical protein